MEKQDDTGRTESVFPIDEHEEFVSEGGRRVRRQGIYLLPNLLTLGALFSGFYAIIAGMGGDFNAAGWAVLIASVFDGLDGRVARLTGTQSAFGAEFDSLSDMVSFGMAPALIAFSWGLSSLGNPGWAAAFIFMSCAALRLARFNVQLGTVSKRFFVGLQSPVAAGLVTFCVWVAALYDVRVTPGVAYTLAAITVIAGLLMVSNYRYFSFKEMNLKGTVPYVVFLMFVALLVLIAQNPHETLLGMCVLYALSGPVLWIYRRQGRGSGKGGSEAVEAAEVEGDPDSNKQPRGDAGAESQVERPLDSPLGSSVESPVERHPEQESIYPTARNEEQLLDHQKREPLATQEKSWQKYTVSRSNRAIGKPDWKSRRLVSPERQIHGKKVSSASVQRLNKQKLQARRLTDRVKLSGKGKSKS